MRVLGTVDRSVHTGRGCEIEKICESEGLEDSGTTLTALFPPQQNLQVR